jgi:hypothetical protein
MVKTQRVELEEQKAHSIGTLSLCPKVLRELDLLSTALRRFVHALDATDREHYIHCTQLYYAYATEYDKYVADHYAAFNLSEDELLHKARKARQSFLTERASLPPHECWPDFYQAVDTQDTSHEADAPAPPEPVQPEPVAGSTLSIEASVILTDNQPEVPKTSLPECETTAKRARPVSGPAVVVPCPEPNPVVPCLEWPPFTPATREAREASISPPQMVHQVRELPVSSPRQVVIQGALNVPHRPWLMASSIPGMLPATAAVEGPHKVLNAPHQIIPSTGEIALISPRHVMSQSASTATVSLLKQQPATSMVRSPREEPVPSPQYVASLRGPPLYSTGRNMARGIATLSSPDKAVSGKRLRRIVV